jgi:hypothetical protein
MIFDHALFLTFLIAGTASSGPVWLVPMRIETPDSSTRRRKMKYFLILEFRICSEWGKMFKGEK